MISGRLWQLTLLFPLLILSGGLANAQVQPVSTEIREKFQLDEFYQKMMLVDDFPIVGSANVSDAAIREAAWIVTNMTGHRPEIRSALAEAGTRMAVMAHNEYTSDIPEHSRLKPRVYWDRRARGLGATPRAPAVSCAEENLLCFEGDPYSTENICIHEFAHAIHIMALRNIDDTFETLLKKSYEAAIEKGLWKGTYAGSNIQEYFAEATQSWFDNNRDVDALHNHVNTRDELREYDPALAALCEKVYGDIEWRYRKPGERDPAQRAHLEPFPIPNAPVFRWRPEPVPDTAQVLIQTAIGDIELELDARAAPETVKNFLHYVHEGHYADGSFFRTVRKDNQSSADVPISVIQGCANPAKADSFPPPVRLERTSETGLSHTNGTISMAREGPDSARHHFFICIGDQPELDFGGKRNPDGQGFAAFGRVVKGMEVVEKIHSAAVKEDEPEILAEPVLIQRAIRNN